MHSKLGSCRRFIILPFLVLLLGINLNHAAPQPEEAQTYIVCMDHTQKPNSFVTHAAWYEYTLNSVSSVCLGDKLQNALLYSYKQVIRGFSARLTPCQLSLLESSPAHVATFEESFGSPLTTHTPEFLGLETGSGIWPSASYGSDVIIGIIDSGIWPESESFRDDGMSPVPSRWQGECDAGTAFSPSLCNKKLIGARYFNKGFLASGGRVNEESDFNSARDSYGHGTHVSSTAAGNHVLGVSHLGYARGTATGMAPNAHIAVYKVLWNYNGTFILAMTDVLAAMDQAVLDGVDIMSISLVSQQRTNYYGDLIATASLSAVQKGVFVVCAAGNDGPGMLTVKNGAPWIMTVGAGSTDRSFIGTMELGDGSKLEGISYFPASVYIRGKGLYHGEDGANKTNCSSLALTTDEVAGRIVLCDSGTDKSQTSQMIEVSRARGYAAIIIVNSFSLMPLSNDFSFPTIFLNVSAGDVVKEYIRRESNATVKSMRFMVTTLGNKPAPQVAYFSSRGPNPISPSILKPDILAPGQDILAAVVPITPYMTLGGYELATDYAIYSGTSMATPHVAGVAALVKAVHRDWSPAAIHSALMTTAATMDNANGIYIDQETGLASTPLDFGAGYVNPNGAMDPGLIYDTGLEEYIEFLCSLGYTKEQMDAIIRGTFEWSCGTNSSDINYPLFVAIFSNETVPTSSWKNFSRTVTNVGDPTSSYRASLEVPDGMRVMVEPTSLVFTGEVQQQGFQLSVQLDTTASPATKYGFLKWIDENNHIVSSPIVAIYT